MLKENQLIYACPEEFSRAIGIMSLMHEIEEVAIIEIDYLKKILIFRDEVSKRDFVNSLTRYITEVPCTN